MRISDWSSDVCSSDLCRYGRLRPSKQSIRGQRSQTSKEATMLDATQRAVRPYRQGDVLLVPCTDIPTRAFEEAAENGRVVLARGERTGHAHTMPADRVRYFREDGTGNGFIRVAGPPPVDLRQARK